MFNIFDFFKNDLKDIEEGKVTDQKEIDSLVKKYKDKGAKVVSKIKEEMEKQNKARKENKEAKEDLGETTSDDIAAKRRKKLWNYVWKFLLITFLVIILTALYTVLTTGPKKQKTKTQATKVLEGIQTEDGDYFESRVMAQISEITNELKKVQTEKKKREEEAKILLDKEAEKNKSLEKKLKALQVKLEQKDTNITDAKISAILEEKIAKIKKDIVVKTGRRPDPVALSHRIAPLPSNNNNKEEDNILVAKKSHTKPLLPKEEKELKAKVKHATQAIQEEYEYSNISIEVLPIDKKIADNKIDENKKKPKYPLHVMTGFAKATLITGVDAPTFGAGKANPVPVILSLDSNEIIANGFDANLQDCMLIGQAFGNMNTMRAEIEVTRISCNIEKDGVMHKIESNIKGWVYDENSVHGLQGRLVDSAGRIITKEIGVGFLQGVATAFAQPKTTIQTLGTAPSQIFESGNLKDGAYRGLAQGTGNALNYLSKYYTKLLDGAYPFISVRSGRRVTVLFKGGENIQMSPYERIDVDSDEDIYDEEEVDVNGW